MAGVAVAVRGEAQPESAWVPSSDQEEPAFLAYSITKTFTAVLFLLLQEEGRLTLGDSLACWFPRITGAEQISLRYLLNHTAGIPDSRGEDDRSGAGKVWGRVRGLSAPAR